MKICPQCLKLYWDDEEFCSTDGTLLQKHSVEPKHQRPVKTELPQKLPELKGQNPVSQYRRQCKACGTVWHSLVLREQQLQIQQRGNTCDEVSMCGNPSAGMQAKRSSQATLDEIVRLHQCPKCNSASYNENIVTY